MAWACIGGGAQRWAALRIRWPTSILYSSLMRRECDARLAVAQRLNAIFHAACECGLPPRQYRAPYPSCRHSLAASLAASASHLMAAVPHYEHLLCTAVGCDERVGLERTECSYHSSSSMRTLTPACCCAHPPNPACASHSASRGRQSLSCPPAVASASGTPISPRISDNAHGLAAEVDGAVVADMECAAPTQAR